VRFDATVAPPQRKKPSTARPSCRNRYADPKRMPVRRNANMNGSATMESHDVYRVHGREKSALVITGSRTSITSHLAIGHTNCLKGLVRPRGPVPQVGLFTHALSKAAPPQDTCTMHNVLRLNIPVRESPVIAGRRPRTAVSQQSQNLRWAAHVFAPRPANERP
jgi:hypothetical protein